jgi:hypothetical protein
VISISKQESFGIKKSAPGTDGHRSVSYLLPSASDSQRDPGGAESAKMTMAYYTDGTAKAIKYGNTLQIFTYF